MESIRLTNNLPSAIKSDLKIALTVLDLMIPSDYSANFVQLVAVRRQKETNAR